MNGTDLRITGIAIWRGRPPARDVLEVKTAGGLVGRGEGAWGECALRRRPGLVIGRSPFEAEAIFEELSSLSGEPPGGLDMALWDLAGKALEKPVYQILGKPFRTKAPLCASVPDAAEAPGFRMVRLEADALDLNRLPKSYGTTRFGLRLTAATIEDALATGERLQDVPLEFWESPVVDNDVAAYRRLREALRVPLAAGPSIPMDILVRDYIQHELTDMVIQDVGRCGLTGLRKLSYFCWLFHVRLVPCCAPSPLSIAAALHAAACLPTVTNALNAPPVFCITAGAPRVELSEGCAGVPCGPGLGVESHAAHGKPELVLGGEMEC